MSYKENKTLEDIQILTEYENGSSLDVIASEYSIRRRSLTTRIKRAKYRRETLEKAKALVKELGVDKCSFAALGKANMFPFTNAILNHFYYTRAKFPRKEITLDIVASIPASEYIKSPNIGNIVLEALNEFLQKFNRWLINDIPKRDKPSNDTLKDDLITQRGEFDAVYELSRAYKNLPSVVDDEYPAFRTLYEHRIRELIKALKYNGRL